MKKVFAWQKDAKCADHPNPKDFFPDFGGTLRGSPTQTQREELNRATERAKAYCHGTRDGKECPVLQECMTHAIVFEEFGVWGGTSEVDRDKIRGRRRSA